MAEAGALLRGQYTPFIAAGFVLAAAAGASGIVAARTGHKIVIQRITIAMHNQKGRCRAGDIGDWIATGNLGRVFETPPANRCSTAPFVGPVAQSPNTAAGASPHLKNPRFIASSGRLNRKNQRSSMPVSSLATPLTGP